MVDPIMDLERPAADGPIPSAGSGAPTHVPNIINGHPAVASQTRSGYHPQVTTEAKRILDAALQLPAHEREELIARLEESLERAPKHVDAFWLGEVQRRIGEFDGGKPTLISSENARQVRTEILEHARSHRIE